MDGGGPPPPGSDPEHPLGPGVDDVDPGALRLVAPVLRHQRSSLPAHRGHPAGVSRRESARRRDLLPWPPRAPRRRRPHSHYEAEVAPPPLVPPAVSSVPRHGALPHGALRQEEVDFLWFFHLPFLHSPCLSCRGRGPGGWRVSGTPRPQGPFTRPSPSHLLPRLVGGVPGRSLRSETGGCGKGEEEERP